LAVAPPVRLFGTDGVRGPVGEFLTPELAFVLGRAAAEASGPASPRVLVVRDTRVSGEMLESALCAGVAAAGGQALLGGILPTPAASLLVRRLGLDLAVVISASHNPYQDNGIKFFDAEGRKLSDELEAAVEARIGETPTAVAENGRVRPLLGAQDDYLRELSSRFTPNLDGLRVALDCANGATYVVAPLIFDRLGADVDVIACEPDGTNINAGCGSTHLEPLIARVEEGTHDLGFAFDGDGDRVMAVDRNGRVVDGDEIITRAAIHLRARGELTGNGIAVTVMTNYGVHQAMESAGIEVATTQVGDRYVVDELFERGWIFGGEQSGHIIDLRFTPSGDGIAAALLLLEALDGRDLAETDAVLKLPQSLVNVRVADRDAIEHAAPVWDAVKTEAEALEGRGRVLVRPSGTEPLVRIMVEAPEASECGEVADRLAAVVERELGANPPQTGGNVSGAKAADW
jgi:phosphoglucosamine mutase